MNKKIHNDDTFLARWLSGELSPEEQEAFEASEDFKAFNAIAERSQQFSIPKFDKNKVKSQIDSARSSNKSTPKVIKLRPLYWTSGIAASIVLFITAYALFFNNIEHTTSFGEQDTYALADGTTVQLNSGSTLSYKRWNPFGNRNVSLDGEAYFKVTKGDKFTVKTDQGSVSVLGTEFNVQTHDQNFEVNCYEGKVQVTTTLKQVILTQNKNFRLSNNQTEEWISQEAQPTWISGLSSFRDSSLEAVIKALERQFDVKFTYDDSIRPEQLFTGSFKNDSLDIALKTVFVPFNISYDVIDSKTIKLSSN
ncbi:FecR domain-containing protein [Winogradskyella sp. 3972H.M.0a.05]|uniref:FecR family protein n=1 Tax=Winogradskyella sp. 3972H.M.0a.05 TaxID=2950277 RepID=UPI00339A8317